jgi:hypothetical protein
VLEHHAQALARAPAGATKRSPRSLVSSSGFFDENVLTPASSVQPTSRCAAGGVMTITAINAGIR